MNEVTAYRLYHAHLEACGVCKPGSGIVCEDGRKLHDSWRLEAVKGGKPRSQVGLGAGFNKTWVNPDRTTQLVADYQRRREEKAAKPAPAT